MSRAGHVRLKHDDGLPDLTIIHSTSIVIGSRAALAFIDGRPFKLDEIGKTIVVTALDLPPTVANPIPMMLVGASDPEGGLFGSGGFGIGINAGGGDNSHFFGSGGNGSGSWGRSGRGLPPGSTWTNSGGGGGGGPPSGGAPPPSNYGSTCNSTGNNSNTSAGSTNCNSGNGNGGNGATGTTIILGPDGTYHPPPSGPSGVTGTNTHLGANEVFYPKTTLPPPPPTGNENADSGDAGDGNGSEFRLFSAMLYLVDEPTDPLPDTDESIFEFARFFETEQSFAPLAVEQVPEPAPLPLAAIGSGMMLFWLLRRRRAA